MDKKVLQVSRAVSRRLVRQGAEAVVLFGSRVRGDAYKESDIDIHAIGRGSHYRPPESTVKHSKIQAKLAE
jgi:predicted nucleotidyltransferase